MMLNTIEAVAAIENCRALINQIDAGLFGEGSFGNISSGAELPQDRCDGDLILWNWSQSH
jgi:hypothetical protein